MIDLMPVNAKLVERSKRLINEITGCGEACASQIFEDSGRKIRTAVIMASLEVSKEEAEILLKQGNGNINNALDVYKRR